MKKTFWASPLCSIQSLSCVQLFVTPWTAALQASLSITNSQSLLKLMSIKSVMPSNHLIHCRALWFLHPIFPRIRVFSNETALCIRWPKYWSFSFSISPSNDWFPLGFLLISYLIKMKLICTDMFYSFIKKDRSFPIYRMKVATYMANNPLITKQHSKAPYHCPFSTILYWQNTMVFYFCFLRNKAAQPQFMKQ